MVQKALNEFEKLCIDCVLKIYLDNNKEDILELFAGISRAVADLEYIRENYGTTGVRLTSQEWLAIAKFLFLVCSTDGGEDIIRGLFRCLDEAPVSIIRLLLAALNAAQQGAKEEDLQRLALRALFSISDNSYKGVM